MKILQVTRDDLNDIISTIVIQYNESVNTDTIFETGQKLGMIIEVPDEDKYGLFAQLYLMYRRKLKHRGIKLITPSNKREWGLLKDVAKDAYQFSKENDIPLQEGIVEYLDLAAVITNSMKLVEIRSKNDIIHEVKLAEHIINSDKNREITKGIGEAYSAYYAKTTGHYPKETMDNPIKYAFFVYAAELAAQHKLGPKEFVGLITRAYDWTGDVIRPYQLQGKTAEEVLKTGEYKRKGKVKRVKVNLRDITKRRDD